MTWHVRKRSVRLKASNMDIKYSIEEENHNKYAELEQKCEKSCADLEGDEYIRAIKRHLKEYEDEYKEILNGQR